MVMGAIRFFIFLAAFAPSFQTMLSWMDGDYGLPDPTESAISYKDFFKVWGFLTKAIETFISIIVMADMKLSTDAPFGNPVGKYSFLYLFKVCKHISKMLAINELKAVMSLPRVLHR